jgi:hypothetical protein
VWERKGGTLHPEFEKLSLAERLAPHLRLVTDDAPAL